MRSHGGKETADRKKKHSPIERKNKLGTISLQKEAFHIVTEIRYACRIKLQLFITATGSQMLSCRCKWHNMNVWMMCTRDNHNNSD
jgi:hypothetical protein